MEKDFHFAVTYVVARLAGFEHQPAETIAKSAQYVDDTVSEGVIHFTTGEQYQRISSAHELSNPKIAFSSAERRVWVPFHFLPAAQDNEGLKNKKSPSHDLANALVCRPNSRVAQSMLKLCIEEKDQKFALYRLGITAHVFADTWAHPRFCGDDPFCQPCKKNQTEKCY